MYIAIQTGYVALYDLIAKNIRILGIINAGTNVLATQNAEITIGPRHRDIIVKHLLSGEMYNHRNSTVIDHVNAFLVVVLPIGITLRHDSPRVEGVYCIGNTQV